MNQLPNVSLNTSGGALLSSFTQPVFEHRQLLQLSKRKEEQEAYFVDYIPPARDALTLPPNVVYALVGVVVIIVATYAIVGHLIDDLLHDLAVSFFHPLVCGQDNLPSGVYCFFKDWMFGPKPVDDDSEGGGAENEEEERLSFSSKLMEKDELRMEEEKEGLLPGFHQGETGCRRPSTPPLRSAIAPSYPGEKRISTHSVTFACPVNPYATSL